MFKPIKNTRVYESVIEEIKQMIANGTLKRGDKLPSERELVQELQVSRTSIREALRALEIMGLVECRQGDGNFIRESFENSLFEPLSVMFMLQRSSPLDILEVRNAIEVQTVELAAKRVTDEALMEIRELVDLLKQEDDEHKNSKIDKEFHYKIAEASGNFLLLNVLKAVSDLMDSFISEARILIMQEEENREVLKIQHENIYEALSEHNEEKAVKAMKAHLEYINYYLIKNNNSLT